MPDMILRQVALTVEEDEQFHRHAAELGLSVDELLATALRQVIQRMQSSSRTEPSPEWLALKAMMLSRSTPSVSDEQRIGGRGWNRDDAYTERMDRLSR